MGVEVSEKGRHHDSARVVRRYLSALDTRKPGRSAARTAESVQHRMHQIDTQLLSADPVRRLHLTQERIDLHAESLRLQTGSGGDFETLEKAFIRVAKAYGDRHAVTYSAWRQIGVDAEVLAQAGIHQAAKPPRLQPSAKSAPEGTAPPESPTADQPAVEVPVAEVQEPPAPSAERAPSAKKSVTKAKDPDPAKSPARKKPAPPKKAPAKKAGAASNGATAKPAKKAAKPAEAAQSEQQQLPAEAHLLS